MKKVNIYTAILVLALSIYSIKTFSANVRQVHTIAFGEELPINHQYTIKLSNLAVFKEGNITIVLRNDQGKGNLITFSNNTINAGQTNICSNFDLTQSQDYTITVNNDKMYLYCNNILFGSSDITEVPVKTCIGTQAELSILNPYHLLSGYEVEIISYDQAHFPDEMAMETNIKEMFPAHFNRIKDPYINKGFINHTGRTFCTQEAVLEGWGPDASIEFSPENIYSGNSSLKVIGAGGANYPSLGASIDQTYLTLKKDSTYLIRAMIKSDQYRGHLGYLNNSDPEEYTLYIPNTNNQWRLIEKAIKVPEKQATGIYFNNGKQKSSGTLWVDNFELISVHTDMTKIPTEAGAVFIPAKEKMNPDQATTIHRLNFSSDENNTSQANLANTQIIGEISLQKNFKSSQYYPLYFPKNIKKIVAEKGCVPLIQGKDYFLYTFDGENFIEQKQEKELNSGAYLFKIAQELEAQTLIFYFSHDTTGSPNTGNTIMTGNKNFENINVNENIYKYEATTNTFKRTKANTSEIKPFEAYIQSTKTTNETITIKIK